MNGKELESFVSDLEQFLLPAGFSADVRRREYNPDGVQLAEFDIVFTGPLGSASVSWLIECRDRPSDGPADGAWIEQLVGRRDRFSFDKVMAVSTTGFALGAIDYARDKGIELRSVKRLTAKDVFDWFQSKEFRVIRRSPHLEDATIYISENEPQTLQTEAAAVISRALLAESTLRDPIDGQNVSAADAFMRAIARRPHLWPAEVHDQWSVDVEIDEIYPVDHRYEIVTAVGSVSVPRITFKGRLVRIIHEGPREKRSGHS